MLDQAHQTFVNNGSPFKKSALGLQWDLSGNLTECTVEDYEMEALSLHSVK